jgi:hypothetical protein
MLRKLSLIAVFLLGVAPLAACDEGEGVEADPYVDGTTVSTHRGAFDVTLTSDSGDLVLGENHLVVRVAFPDPNDPNAEGKGVPGAEIELDAWMPNEDHTTRIEPSVTYLGDGEYLVAPVLLDRAGVWALDFDIRVGASIDETAAFAFDVE